MTSILHSPITVSASALSYESPQVPTGDARFGETFGVVHREILAASIAEIHERSVALPITGRLL